MHILNEQSLNATITQESLGFQTTAELIATQPHHQSDTHAWVAQSEAKKAALFGLNIQQRGFNVLVLGAHGSGRTSLMQSAMQEVAKQAAITQPLHDLVALYDFNQFAQPTLIKLPVGQGAKLRTEMDGFSRALIAEFTNMTNIDTQAKMLAEMRAWLDEATKKILDTFVNVHQDLTAYLQYIAPEVLAYLQAWQPPPANESDNPLEGLINEAFFARFRVNLLVDNRASDSSGLYQAIIYDNDPSLSSLFGAIESATDASLMPDFLRLRAGNLHKADGGMLLMHLRDILNDEQNGQQIIEKLHRFLRNGTLQIEDITNSAQSSTVLTSNTLLPLQVKFVMIATREDFYDCLDEQPDFFDYFPIKVEFAERIQANKDNYAAIAGYIAQKCEFHQCAHFNSNAVATLIIALQRIEEDQTRISTNFAYLEQLMLESVAFAGNATVVTEAHVNAALQAKAQRNQYFESQIRDSIIDNELLIQVHGEVVGQVNGLTHIELGDASFGSPIRITARCYPGKTGLINIDREVNMSGPNHDKGIFILQNWLSASFWQLAPLSLNASLVFEQEYNGVEGDSASCAELFALLSALAGLPIKQGIAVTGALNQFGEVMPIGGVNEKIEGYFRVCQALGLDGQQGVIIPRRNQRHLLLDQEVIAAVKAKQFHIIVIDHVLEGIEYLTGMQAGIQNHLGSYPDNTVLGHAQQALANYRKTLESNQAKLHQLPLIE
jgi:predicted ATP-dependent protease